MNKSLKVGRLGAKYCWRIGSLQKRHYADRYTIDDLTQARIDAANRKPSNAPRENPWRDNQWSPDFPKRLDELGYESHCNDRLYIAKNKQRYTQQEYEQQRLERRMEAQQRVQDHFDGQARPESRRRFVMQDPSEHQKRQELIIEMNRRRWQSRPEAKREINNSGITYRPEIQKQWKELVNAQNKSQADTKAEDGDWRVRRESPDSGLQGRQNRLIKSSAEDGDWRVRRESPDSGLQRRPNRPTNSGAEDGDWRVRRESPDSGLQRRPNRPTNSGAEDGDWRVRRESPDSGLQRRQNRPIKSGAEEEAWRVRRESPDSGLQRRQTGLVKSPRSDAEEEGGRSESPDSGLQRRQKSPRSDAEEKGWRVRKESPDSGLQRQQKRVQPQDTRLQERLARLMARAEAEANTEVEQVDSPVKRPRGGAEEEGLRVRRESPDSGLQRRPRSDAEEEARRVRRESPDSGLRVRGQREEAWRVRRESPDSGLQRRQKSPRSEADDGDWRVRRESPDSGLQRRQKSPRSEADDGDWRVRRESPDSGLQSRLKTLMERSQEKENPDAEEDAWRVQSPRAEVEESPKGEAEADKSGSKLSMVYDPNRPSEAWLKKKQAEEESQYWHSWHTCPSNREAETNVEVQPHNRRKKVVNHPPSYSRDGQRRGYHQLVPPTNRFKARTIMLLRRRRPNGIQQQYHKFARQQAPLEAQPEPLSNTEPMPKPLRLIPEKEKKAKPKRKGDRQPVQPPRFKMTIKSRPSVTRNPTPVASYSRRLNIPPEVAGPSFYMANLRSSVSESWRTFAGNYAQ